MVTPTRAISGITDGLHQPDLGPFERHNPADHHVHEEHGDTHEHRRQDPGQRAQLRDLAVEEGVADLRLAPVRAVVAVGGEDPFEIVDHALDRRARDKEKRDRVERPGHVEGRSQRALAHPDDAHAAVVGHHLAGTDGIDVLWRQHRADDRHRPLLPVEQHREGVADDVPVRLGEGFVDDDLVARLDPGPVARAQRRHVQKGRPVVGDRLDPGLRRLDPSRQVEKDERLDARLGGVDAVDGADLGHQRQRRAVHLREDLGEAVAFVEGRPRVVEGARHAERHEHHRHAGRQHQRDRQSLRPEPAEVAQELAVDGAQAPHHSISAGATRVSLRITSLIRPS
jgi:hypothetical protein